MWFWYSLFFALWSSVQTVLIKSFTEKLGSKQLLFTLNIFGISFVLLLLVIGGGFPHVTFAFFQNMFVSAVLDTVAFLASISAIRMSQISLLAPLSSFGPVFTVFIAIFTLGETSTPLKFFGVLLTVVGAYFLNIKDIKKGIFKPFENLFRSRGSQLFLLATLLWSITPIFQKKAIFETSPTTPLFASFVGIVLVTIFITPFVLGDLPKISTIAKQNFKILIIFGLFTALSQLAAYTAFAQANVGYVSAILRMSSLFTIILGGKFLKEERISERILGAAIMVAGALLIVLKA